MLYCMFQYPVIVELILFSLSALYLFLEVLRITVNIHMLLVIYMLNSMHCLLLNIIVLINYPIKKYRNDELVSNVNVV